MAVLLLLLTYALLSLYAAASQLWQAPGTIGIVTDYDATIRAVIPGTPAARDGVAAGDQVLLDRTPFEDRSYISGPGTYVQVGRVIVGTTAHHGALHNLKLQAVPEPLNGPRRAAVLLLCFASVVFIAVGATLIVLRPSPATWGFGLYCLLYLPTSIYPITLSDAGIALALTLLYDIIQNFGVVGLLLFVLEFPQAYDVPWRNRIRRALPALFVVLAAMTLYPDIANQLLARGAELENGILQLTFGAVFVVAMVILFDTYRRVERDERERLRWVLIGFGFGLFGSYVGDTLIYSTLIAAVPPPSVSVALTSLNVLLPLAVAHAVIRHRVLDVRFVIGRALVFAVLTTIVAAVFALLDYLFGTVLEDFHIVRVVAAIVSLAIAFAFKWFEARLSDAIEAVFFRRRHLAEMRLGRAAHALPHARSFAVIESTLIEEAADAIGLTSAALFRQDQPGPFVRTTAVGWGEGDRTALDDTDRLVLTLRTDNKVVDLAEFNWRAGNVPAAEHEPAIAVPIYVRAELTAIAFYGAHLDGGRLEPDEIALLERLAEAAGLAIDQLEAQQLRDETIRQRAVIADLTARLDELRHQL